LTVSSASISKLETATAYRNASLATSCHITDMCDHAESRGIRAENPIIQSWRKDWEEQRERAGSYNAAVEAFIGLEDRKRNGGKGTTPQEWRDHFDVVVDKMEIWAERMREILANEQLNGFVANEEALVAADDAKHV